jgi:hypothetical protein
LLCWGRGTGGGKRARGAWCLARTCLGLCCIVGSEHSRSCGISKGSTLGRVDVTCIAAPKSDRTPPALCVVASLGLISIDPVALLAPCVCRITGRRVTFEYTLLAGVNDSPQHAEQLAGLLRRNDSMRSHVNVSALHAAAIVRASRSHKVPPGAVHCASCCAMRDF